MNYGAIKNCDIANGIGVRVSLFVSGCRNHCPGCFQPETWAFDYGQPFTADIEDKIIEMLRPSYINGLTLLGGDPFEPENQRVLTPFLKRIRTELPDKTIWSYSGYTLDEIQTEGKHPHCECTDEMLSMIDVLVDGRFIQEQKDISLRFRGSRNQRVIDLPETLRSGEIVLSPYGEKPVTNRRS